MKKSLVTLFSVATGGAAIVVLLYLRRKQRLMVPSVSSEEKEAPTEVEIVHEGGEAAQAISALVHSTIGEPANISCIKDTSADSLAQSERLLLGFSWLRWTRRRLHRSQEVLRALKKADANTLSGKRIAVLALARSVCSFSAASGGLDKFRGGARLQSALLAAGAWKLCQMGCAEVEMEEVGYRSYPGTST